MFVETSGSISRVEKKQQTEETKSLKFDTTETNHRSNLRVSQNPLDKLKCASVDVIQDFLIEMQAFRVDLEKRLRDDLGAYNLAYNLLVHSYKVIASHKTEDELLLTQRTIRYLNSQGSVETDDEEIYNQHIQKMVIAFNKVHKRYNRASSTLFKVLDQLEFLTLVKTKQLLVDAQIPWRPYKDHLIVTFDPKEEHEDYRLFNRIKKIEPLFDETIISAIDFSPLGNRDRAMEIDEATLENLKRHAKDSAEIIDNYDHDYFQMMNGRAFEIEHIVKTAALKNSVAYCYREKLLELTQRIAHPDVCKYLVGQLTVSISKTNQLFNIFRCKYHKIFNKAEEVISAMSKHIDPRLVAKCEELTKLINATAERTFID